MLPYYKYRCSPFEQKCNKYDYFRTRSLGNTDFQSRSKFIF